MHRPKLPSVDAARDTFHCNWISADELDDSLVAQSYRPTITEAMREVQARGCVPLRAISSSIKQGRTPVYAESGVPCLKTKQVESVLVEPVPDSFVSEQYAAQNDHLRVAEETILITRSGAGSIGRAGIYLRADRPMTNEHLVHVQVAAPNDAGYLAAFLSSWWGERALEKGITGSTGQLQLNQDRIAGALIAVPDPAIQRAIGNKVRKAERLRELAKAGRARVSEWIAGNAALTLLSADSQQFLEHFPASTIRYWSWESNVDTADRLDPWPTHVAPTTVRHHLSKHGKVRQLCELARRVTANRKRREFADPSVKGHYVSVLDLDFNGSIDWEKASRSRYTGNGIELEPADILYSCINPQQPRVGVVPGEMTGLLVGSPEFALLQSTSSLIGYPNLLAAVLRSGWVRVQASFLTRSSSLSRRRLDEKDLDGVLVPWSDDQNEELEKAAFEAVIGDQAARAMIEDARSAVESLIDGTLDEAALLTEGEAIERWLANNPSRDETEKP